MEQLFAALGHNESQNHFNSVYSVQQIQPHHKASFSHEAIAAAVGFASMHAYESHLRATGKQPSHVLMKEILAAIAAAEAEKLIETKGLDWLDRHKAKKMAVAQAHHLAEQRYQGGSGWEYAQSQGGHAMEYNYTGGAPWGAQGHPAYNQYGYQGGGYAPPPAPYQQAYPQQYAQPSGYGAPPQAPYGVQPGYNQQHGHHHHHGHHH